MLRFYVFMYKLPFFFVLLLLFPSLVYAGTVKGTLYDVSLDRVHDATVDISTIPQQRYLSKDGAYSFKVTNGTYTLHAQQYKNEEVVARATETLVVEGDGDYRLDLILFPVVDIPEDLLGDAIFDVNNIIIEKTTPKYWWLLLFIPLLLAVGYGTYWYARKQQKQSSVLITSPQIIHELDKMTIEKTLPHMEIKSKEEPSEKPKASQADELQLIVNHLKKEGGRTTQKELRKLFTSSEAKMSLMVAELEHRGVLEKIKKGRGNILILKKEGSNSEQ